MAWIYRAQNGDLMFSKTKPEKVYRFKFRNDQFHSADEDGYGASGIARIFSTLLFNFTFYGDVKFSLH